MQASSIISWKAFLTSSIGKKFTVALTGISLALFLLEHCVSNLMLLYDDPAPFLAYARFMGENGIIRTLEIGLFAGFALHIVSVLLVQAQNRAARPVRYAVQQPSAQNVSSAASARASRLILLTGSVVLIFLVVHLGRFFVPHKVLHSSTVDLYTDTRIAFSSPLYVAFYMLAMALLAFHLVHGVQSAFQTFGLKTTRTARLIRLAGIVFAVGVSAGLALIPLWIYAHQ